MKSLEEGVINVDHEKMQKYYSLDNNDVTQHTVVEVPSFRMANTFKIKM